MQGVGCRERPVRSHPAGAQRRNFGRVLQLDGLEAEHRVSRWHFTHFQHHDGSVPSNPDWPRGRDQQSLLQSAGNPRADCFIRQDGEDLGCRDGRLPAGDTLPIARSRHSPPLSLASSLSLSAFRSLRVTQTRFSAAHSITKARPSSPARKTTRAASGPQSADQALPTCHITWMRWSSASPPPR